MIRGYYTAASGLYTQEKRLNAVANNIANVSTVGYKADNLVLGTFGEHLTIRKNAYQQTQNNEVGPGVYMQIVDDKYTNYTQGGFETTTRPLDMSIMGDGFFVVNGDDGEEYLTRDGQFSLDAEGYLILPGFGRVQGEGGDIALGTPNIVVDARGGIQAMNEDGEYEEIDSLLLGLPNDYAVLEKAPNGLYVADDYAPVDWENEEQTPPLINHYNLERSNVNMADEMTRMIASQRQLQSCSQLVKMHDELSEQIVTRVSRVQA